MRSLSNEEYLQIPIELAHKLRKSKLTAAEHRLFYYLYELINKPLPDLETILEEANISQSTFYRAVQSFKEQDILDIQTETRIRWGHKQDGT